MGVFKSYFAPGAGKAKSNPEAAAATHADFADISKKTLKNNVGLSEKDMMQMDSAPKSLYPSGINTPNGTSPWDPKTSSYPPGDFRNNTAEEIRDMKCDVMVNWLYQQQMEMLWTAGGPDEGVLLKKARGEYACCPADMAEMDQELGFYQAIEMLNVRVSCLNKKFSSQYTY